MNSFLAVLVVLGLVGGLAWVVRRGGFGVLAGKGGSIVVETAAALGERRSLVVVSVEGRRLLLGLTPTHVSLLTELDRGRPTSTSAVPAQATAHATFGGAMGDAQS